MTFPMQGPLNSPYGGVGSYQSSFVGGGAPYLGDAFFPFTQDVPYLEPFRLTAQPLNPWQAMPDFLNPVGVPRRPQMGLAQFQPPLPGFQPNLPGLGGPLGGSGTTQVQLYQNNYFTPLTNRIFNQTVTDTIVPPRIHPSFVFTPDDIGGSTSQYAPSIQVPRAINPLLYDVNNPTSIPSSLGPQAFGAPLPPLGGMLGSPLAGGGMGGAPFFPMGYSPIPNGFGLMPSAPDPRMSGFGSYPSSLGMGLAGYNTQAPEQGPNLLGNPAGLQNFYAPQVIVQRV